MLILVKFRYICSYNVQLVITDNTFSVANMIVQSHLAVCKAQGPYNTNVRIKVASTYYWYLSSQAGCLMFGSFSFFLVDMCEVLCIITVS